MADIMIDSALAGSALQCRMSEPYLLWSIARAGSKGSGKVRVRPLKKLYCELFSYSPKTFYNHISRGSGVFWSASGGALYLKSLDKVCRAMTPVAHYNNSLMVSLDDIYCASIRPKDILVAVFVSGGPRQGPRSILQAAQATGLSRSALKSRLASGVVSKSANSVRRGGIASEHWSTYRILVGSWVPTKGRALALKHAIKSDQSETQASEDGYRP